MTLFQTPFSLSLSLSVLSLLDEDDDAMDGALFMFEYLCIYVFRVRLLCLFFRLGRRQDARRMKNEERKLETS